MDTNPAIETSAAEPHLLCHFTITPTYHNETPISTKVLKCRFKKIAQLGPMEAGATSRHLSATWRRLPWARSGGLQGFLRSNLHFQGFQQLRDLVFAQYQLNSAVPGVCHCSCLGLVWGVPSPVPHMPSARDASVLESFTNQLWRRFARILAHVCNLDTRHA